MKPSTNWKLTCPENNILTVLRVIKKNSLRVLVLAFFPWMGPLSDILAHISLIVTKAYLLLCLICCLTGQSLSSGMLQILFCGITVTFNISQVGGSPAVPEADGRHRSWKRRRRTGFDLFLVHSRKSISWVGAAWQRSSIPASHPAASGPILVIPKNVVLVLLRFIDGTT